MSTNYLVDTIRTESFTMDYLRFGKGDSVFVILPGLSIQSVMGAAEAVAAEYASLAEYFTIYLFDRRKDLPDSYSVNEMAEDTAQAIVALGLKDVYLFGASQGGMMAMVIAIEHPELVKKLVLGSTSSHVWDHQYQVLDRWVAMAQSGERKALYLEFGEKIYPTAVFEQFRDVLAAAAESVTDEDLKRFVILAEGTRGFNITADLVRIKCPVLAIGVFEDAVLDSDATMEIAEKLDERKDFKLYMYIGFGHAAFDTAPDYRERIMHFLLENENTV